MVLFARMVLVDSFACVLLELAWDVCRWLFSGVWYQKCLRWLCLTHASGVGTGECHWLHRLCIRRKGCGVHRAAVHFFILQAQARRLIDRRLEELLIHWACISTAMFNREVSLTVMAAAC